MADWVLRRVKSHDAADLVDIYNYYIKHSVVTFEYDPLTVQEMAARINAIDNAGFFVVAESPQTGDVVGYAYAKPWNDRAGYRFTYESSIYLKNDRDVIASKGLGTLLYRHLLALVKESGKVKVLLGVLDSGNQASVALHQKLGFAKMATLPNVAVKFDQSLSIDYWAYYFTH